MKGDDFSVSIAKTDSELEALYKLRYQIYCHEIKVFNPKTYPDGLERDEFDPFSVHFQAKRIQDGIAVGCIRLINAEPLGFQLEKQFTLDPDIDRFKLLEASRYLVLRSCRHQGISHMLAVAAEEWSHEHGYEGWLSVAPRRYHNAYERKYGWAMQTLREIDTLR